MANTVFVRGGAHAASVEEVWGEKTWRQAEKDAYFNDGKFVGESSNSLIQVNTDLTKNKGDRINTPLRARLISDGKVDDARIHNLSVQDQLHLAFSDLSQHDLVLSTLVVGGRGVSR